MLLMCFYKTRPQHTKRPGSMDCRQNSGSSRCASSIQLIRIAGRPVELNNTVHELREGDVGYRQLLDRLCSVEAGDGLFVSEDGFTSFSDCSPSVDVGYSGFEEDTSAIAKMNTPFRLYDWIGQVSATPSNEIKIRDWLSGLGGPIESTQVKVVRRDAFRDKRLFPDSAIEDSLRMGGLSGSRKWIDQIAPKQVLASWQNIERQRTASAREPSQPPRRLAKSTRLCRERWSIVNLHFDDD